MKQNATKQNGFTLIEVMVAFTIMALGLAALLQAFSSGLRNIGVAESYAVAAMEARSKLAEIGQVIDLEAGQSGGDLDSGGTWRAVVEPYETGTPGVEEVGVQLKAFSVAVTVTWDEGRELTLRSLRLATER